MKFTPETRSVGEIFAIGSSTQYIIPIYQRNYSWKNDNVEELFIDIYREKEGYYLGNLLITNNINEDSNTFDIVDGQQRLTTLSLILLGLYDYFSKNEDNINNLSGDYKSLKREANTIISDIPRQLYVKDDEEKPKLRLQEPDKSLYNDLLKLLYTPSEFKPHKNRIIGKRFAYIQELIVETFNDEDMNRKFPEQIRTAVEYYNKLNAADLLRIEVSDLTDAFTIFTSFNAKGQPLTLIDLMKSYYLSEAVVIISPEEGQRKWNQLIGIFYNENEEPNSSVITQFLQNHYDAFEAAGSSSITKGEALKAYQNLFRERKEKYIEELTQSAKYYSVINSRIETTEEISESPKYTEKLDYYLEQISNLDATTAHPLILFLLTKYFNDQITVRTVYNILSFLKNYYVRRNITLKPKSSNIRSKILASIRELEKSNNLDGDALDTVKKHLNSIISSDYDFKNALMENVYDTNASTTRIILIDIERTKGNYFDKQNPDTLDEELSKYNKRWTLEHILPQTNNLSDYWKKMIIGGDDSITEEEIEAIQNNNKHKLGNLTLTGYNSELSTKDFVEKRDYPTNDESRFTGLRTPLYLNQSIPGNDETIEEKDEWTINDINRRTKILAQDTFNLYPIE